MEKLTHPESRRFLAQLVAIVGPDLFTEEFKETYAEDIQQEIKEHGAEFGLVDHNPEKSDSNSKKEENFYKHCFEYLDLLAEEAQARR